MARYKITIEYDGSDFFGWQRQNNGPSVQESIEDAIKQFTHQKITVFGAGRTDAGVHATGQVAHFELTQEYALSTIQSAINHFVKPKISILSVEQVSQEFHARFSAKKKRYIYRIANRSSHLAILHKRAWLIKDSIDLQSISEAADILVGKHDFSSFRAAGCQSQNPVKTIDKIELAQKNEDVIDIVFEGKSFLHNQVRIMASALKNVGIGKWDVIKLKQILQAKDRRCSAETAPPYGLYLARIWYD